jgi:glycosyltransferase involved in cell wall biosynthesis
LPARSVPPEEIVVVDDESTDHTGEVAGSMGRTVRLIRHANVGAEASRNRGIAEASGEFIAFLDADDVWLPEKLERQLTVFRERPEIGVVGCMVLNVGSPDDPAVQTQLRRYGGRPVPGWFGSDILSRRRVFDTVGLFDSALRHSGVAEWITRCDESGVPRLLVRESLVVRHRRAGSGADRKSSEGTTETVDDFLRLVHRRIVGRRLRQRVGEPF